MSHHHHHKNTGNIDKDEIFYPVRMKERGKKGRFAPLFGLGGAWFLYLFVGYGDKPRSANHFNPFHPIFARSSFACIVSIAWKVFVSNTFWHLFTKKNHQEFLRKSAIS